MGYFGPSSYSRCYIWDPCWNIFCCNWSVVRFNDPVSAQYIGFALHIMTGMAAGNIFGQISLFWSNIAPYNSKEGIVKGMVVGMALWIVLFVPLATFVIQPRLDSFTYSAPNQYINDIAGHFKGLYSVIIGGSLVFHLIYGALIGFISGRMTEIGVFLKTDKIVQ